MGQEKPCKGNTLDKANQYQAAYETYTLLIELNPNNPIPYNQRALLLQNIQEFDLSIQDYTNALKLESSDSLKLTLHLNRGVARVKTRDFQGGYDDYMKAYLYDSLNIVVLNNIARVSDEVGKGDQTLTYLNKIIAIDSTFIGAYGNIGFKYHEMGEYRKAISYFNKVLKMEPNEPLGYSNRSYNYYKLGEYDNALNDINNSIRLYPTNSYAFRIRGLIYLAQKDQNRACKDFTDALEFGFTRMYGEEVETLKKKHCVFENL